VHAQFTPASSLSITLECSHAFLLVLLESKLVLGDLRCFSPAKVEHFNGDYVGRVARIPSSRPSARRNAEKKAEERDLVSGAANTCELICLMFVSGEAGGKPTTRDAQVYRQTVSSEPSVSGWSCPK
jgi:hypothetical protein